MRQTATPLKLYIVEEQEVYHKFYQAIFPPEMQNHPVGKTSYPIDLIKVSDFRYLDCLSQQILRLRPDVILLSTRKLKRNTIEILAQIRFEHPGIGIVLMPAFCNNADFSLLRELSLTGKGGMGLLMKQSLEQSEQLYGLIMAVSRGQVVLDPSLAGFLFTEDIKSPFLKQLTARELEILGLLSRGYTNARISQTLTIDIKTVEHHMNSMYGKIKAEANFDNLHSRVSAARLYLEATGELMATPAPRRDFVTVPVV